MKYLSYLFSESGQKLTRHQRHGGANGRANMNLVYNHNKALHSKRAKRGNK